MRRREFIAGLASAAALPLTVRAQQLERMRHIGVLMFTAADEPESKNLLAAFLQELQQLGSADGRNLRIDYRWSGGDVARLRRDSADLAALGPDIILAGVGPTAETLRQVTHTVPVVFAQNIDPVGNGIVARLSRPGGNATGFMQFEYSLSGKWPELLKEAAPHVTRVAVVRDPVASAGIGQWAIIQAVAPSFKMELFPIEVQDAGVIERSVVEFAREPGGGMIVAVSAAAATHRELIVALAARHRLPTVYAYSHFVTAGGLISYGANLVDQYRRSASYVDRILKGEKPADLPVQAPTKYELAINLKAAKALGLTMPPTLLARADEVIE